MNEVNLGAGRTHHGGVAVFCILRRVSQPMLHIHPGLGTSEEDGSVHGPAICQCAALPKTPDVYVGLIRGPQRPPTVAASHFLRGVRIPRLSRGIVSLGQIGACHADVADHSTGLDRLDAGGV
jgi:hypothetical protein